MYAVKLGAREEGEITRASLEFVRESAQSEVVVYVCTGGELV